LASLPIVPMLVSALLPELLPSGAQSSMKPSTELPGVADTEA
jgi:hypothetical protein